MKVDNLLLEKALGEGSFGEVFLTKIEPSKYSKI